MHVHSLFGTYLTIPLYKTVTLTCFFPYGKVIFWFICILNIVFKVIMTESLFLLLFNKMCFRLMQIILQQTIFHNL